MTTISITQTANEDITQESIQGYRLSPQQQYLWLFDPDPTSFLCDGSIKILGTLDISRLNLVLSGLKARYEILRTSFYCPPSLTLPLQFIHESKPVVCEQIDLSRFDKEEQAAHLTQGREKVEFDYERGEMMRCCVVKLSAEEHVLRISILGLCADVRTMNNLLREIMERYGREGGERCDTEVLQYADFSEWQNQMLESEEANAGRDYWLAQNIDPPSSLKLPYERELWSISGNEPESVSFMIGEDVSRRAERLASKHDTSLAVILQACWHSLLWRLTGFPDIVVETAFDGRKYEELRVAIGRFVTHLPIRCHFEEECSFDEVVRKIERSNLAADEWQEVFLQPQRQQFHSLEEKASLPIGFEYEEWPASLSIDGTSFSVIQLNSQTNYFKLKLCCARTDEGARVELQYDRALYQSEDVRRLAREYETLLKSAVAAPFAPLHIFSLLTNAERQQVLYEWNETATDFDEESCLHELFEAQVEQTPEACAVLFKNQHLTYGELNRRANSLAHHLCALGVGPEMLVGILLEHSPEMIIALLAIWKTGAAFVPFDLSAPTERLSIMLKDTGMSVLLSQQQLAVALPPLGLLVVCLDSDAERIAQASKTNLRRRATAQNLAYVIYTSGSTGRPKGVMVEHRSVVNLCAALQQAVYVERGPSLKVSVNAPLAFDTSIKQIIQMLVGHTLCLIPEEVRRDGKEFLNYIKQHRVEVLDCTPSQMRLLLDSGFLTETDYSPSAVLLGGEALDDGLWQSLCDSRKIDFYNLYGPTECTVDAASCLLKSDRTSPTFGSPLANVRAYLLDRHLEPVPIGVAGELYLGGVGLSRGYLNQLERTSKMFLPDPFSRKAGERMYRTGDVARYSPDGQMEYLGRTDHQVKIRGYRIELGEIESLLMEHPSVREAVAIVREDTPGDKKLVSYIVPHCQPVASESRAKYRLPNGMHIAYLNRAETDYLYQEIFEEEVYFKHGIELLPGACVFDVGANIGLFTLFISEHYQGADIYAFEPINPIFETLQLNAAVYAKDVKLFQFGLAEVEKTGVFAYYPNFSARSGLKEFASASDEEAVTRQFLRNKEDGGVPGMGELAEVADELMKGKFVSEDYECPLRRLSDVIREERVKRIDLLKVDVQQAELQVLQGITNDDWTKIKQVTMEVHDAAGQASQGRLAKILSLLNKQGFDVVAEQDKWLKGTDRHNVYAIRRESQGGGGSLRLHATEGSAGFLHLKGKASTAKLYESI